MATANKHIEIIPAIDIIDGECVRLTQGDYGSKKAYDITPVEMARRYELAGITRLHLVDLNGAKAGKPCNLPTLREIASSCNLDIEWGGGIKTPKDLEEALEAGATHIIIGSLAVKQPQIVEQWLRKYGGDKIVLGADVRNGKVAVSGWLEESSLSINDLIEHFIPHGLEEVIVTDISKDGMLQGPSTQLYVQLMELYPQLTFTVSGGISSINDIIELDSLGLPRVIVGKAIYENNITIEEITNFITEQ
ncbi:MAG: 1-(5-phosphoribosyl)-5-[(5-phosphoribosylamino)methylideneamino]imidazole-4-carboxamide isomerase [Clostridiales bacterium]|nr:1-(5-phosphoribosyl)-5-[(5-phosphoribosylamino)methylideneamino]imidazole-4-carboxamide isomerase [Clostridiales bacterium]